MFRRNSTGPAKGTLIIVGVAVAFFGSALLAKPRLQMGPDAEVSHDGLHRVDKTVMDMAWVKPDLDLAAYTKLMVLGAGMSFRTVDNEGRRYWPGRSNDTEFPISDEGKLRLREELREVFADELSEIERYELVDEPGRGVLLLQGALIDIVSAVPPEDACIGRCEIYLNSVGEATLVLELRDSMSNEILARAVDRRAAASGGWPIEANTVMVWAEVRQLGRTWGRLIRRRLDDFESVDDLMPRR